MQHWIVAVRPTPFSHKHGVRYITPMPATIPVKETHASHEVAIEFGPARMKSTGESIIYNCQQSYFISSNGSAFASVAPYTSRNLGLTLPLPLCSCCGFPFSFTPSASVWPPAKRVKLNGSTNTKDLGSSPRNTEAKKGLCTSLLYRYEAFDAKACYRVAGTVHG
jgi:hypothetical protein